MKFVLDMDYTRVINGVAGVLILRSAKKGLEENDVKE